MAIFGLVHAQINTALGTQDFTTTDLGGFTPKAAVVIVGGATALDANAGTARASIGIADATRQQCIAGVAQDGVGTTNSSREGFTDRLVHIFTTTAGTDGVGEFDSFITNGIRIDWTDAPAAARHCMILLIAGDDVDVRADILTLGLQDVEVDVTAPGFLPKAVFFAGIEDTIPSTLLFDMAVTYGWAIDGDQRGKSYRFRDGFAAGTPQAEVYSNRVAGQSFGGGANYSVEASNFDASGFSVTARDNDSGGDQLMYLAIEMNNAVAVLDVDTPPTNGDEAYIGVGFKPQFVFLGTTAVQTRDTFETNFEAGSKGIGMFRDDTEQWAINWMDEDGSGTADTKSRFGNHAAIIREDDGTIGFQADFVSMDADGFTIDFSTTNPSVAQVWFGFAVEGEPAQGQVSWTELEIPDIEASGDVSWAEFEAPDVTARGAISYAEFEVPFPFDHLGHRGQISWAELETLDPQPDKRGQFGFAELEIPDVVPTATGQVSWTELQTPDVGGGGGALSVISFAEFELAFPLAVQISRLFVTTPEPRRRGRVSWARVEFASVPGPNRQIKIISSDINRDLFLEELDVYGIKPDVGFFLPGFEPLDDPLPEDETNNNEVDPQRVWTPKDGPSVQFGEVVQPGEMWFDYSFVLTDEDLFHILFVCEQHNATQTTEDQDQEDQFAEDLDVLRDYNTRCDSLTQDEKDDCHCRLLRFVLNLSTETTVRRIQDEPITDEELELE